MSERSGAPSLPWHCAERGGDESRTVLAPDMASSALARRAPQRWSSSELLGGAAEAEILHAGTTYRLRLTALGKLILTK